MVSPYSRNESLAPLQLSQCRRTHPAAKHPTTAYQRDYTTRQQKKYFQLSQCACALTIYKKRLKKKKVLWNLKISSCEDPKGNYAIQCNCYITCSYTFHVQLHCISEHTFHQKMLPKRKHTIFTYLKARVVSNQTVLRFSTAGLSKPTNLGLTVT